MYCIRKLSDKGKFKPAVYPNGEMVAPWRMFKSERELLKFADEYGVDNFVIITKYMQDKEIKNRID